VVERIWDLGGGGEGSFVGFSCGVSGLEVGLVEIGLFEWWVFGKLVGNCGLCCVIVSLLPCPSSCNRITGAHCCQSPEDGALDLTAFL